MASNFYRQKDGPRYILGHGLELGFIGLGLIASFILLFNYKRINKKRQNKIDSGAEQPSAQELSALGDRAVTFRYMY
jgi:hypothetical protein